MRSDSTRVPPVTALRSPPDSRMTGADSPVIADSSTEAIPHTMSPSPGMSSPALTTTTSPGWSSADATGSTGSLSPAPALVADQAVGGGGGAGFAEAGRLCLSPTLRYRFRQIRERSRCPTARPKSPR